MTTDLDRLKGGKLAETLHGRVVVRGRLSAGIRIEVTEPSSIEARRFVDRLVADLRRPNAAAELRLGILELLDRLGPSRPSEIPRSWPVTRQNLRAAVGGLVADGLVERVDATEGAMVRLTPIGRRVLEELSRDASARPQQSR